MVDGNNFRLNTLHNNSNSSALRGFSPLRSCRNAGEPLSGLYKFQDVSKIYLSFSKRNIKRLCAFPLFLNLRPAWISRNLTGFLTPILHRRLQQRSSARTIWDCITITFNPKMMRLRHFLTILNPNLRFRRFTKFSLSSKSTPLTWEMFISPNHVKVAVARPTMFKATANGKGFIEVPIPASVRETGIIPDGHSVG